MRAKEKNKERKEKKRKRNKVYSSLSVMNETKEINP